MRREFDGMDRTYSQDGLNIRIADVDLKAFCGAHYDPAIGARSLPGFIEANIEPIIVNMILDGGASGESSSALQAGDQDLRGTEYRRGQESEGGRLMSDLKDQIDKLKQRIEDRAYEANKAASGQWQVKTAKDITALGRFFAQVTIAAVWIYQNILSPVAGFLAVPANILFGWYRRLWARVVYVEDRFQQKQFSKTRAGMFLAATLFFVWFLFIPLVVFRGRRRALFATVRKDEIVYLTNSQEIMPEENVHSIQGCHTLPCTDDNSFYFRIRASLFNEVWSLANGYGLFYPDYVAAAVPLTISECKITAYGVRMKLMMRGMDIYPDVLRTECTPLTGVKQQTHPTASNG